MTLEQLATQIDIIKRSAGDAEVAHGREDDLREQVLKAIAEGAPDAQELARLVLTTSEIEFARWCA